MPTMNNIVLPASQRPNNVVDWISLITTAISETKGVNWFDANALTLAQLITSINSDPDFNGTTQGKLNLKFDIAQFTGLNILTQIKTVDGTGSGLDADLVKGYVPVNKAGDTMSGFLTLHADPSSTMHAVTKKYVDELIQGFSIKLNVKAATVANVALTGLQTVDGISLIANDRILVKDQTNKAQNGIYLVASGAWTRTTDADAPENFRNGSAVFVEQGVKNADSGWVLITDGAIVVNTTALDFAQFSGAGQIVPIDGIYKDGNVIGLTNTGVSAGVYTKVTVDVKGRITAATILSATDIPVLDWTKITTGKPTLLAGYGITDAVNISEVVTAATANKILKLDGASKLPASITGNADGNAATATKLLTSRTIALAGDVTGSVAFDGTGNVSITTSFKASGVTPGTYTKVTVDAKGNVTSGTTLIASDIPVLDWSKITTGKPTLLSGYGITDAVNVSEVVTVATPNKILKLDEIGKLGTSITGNADGNAGTALKFLTARTISLSGDVTGTVAFDGSTNVNIAVAYKNSGVSAGTYTKVTTDVKGNITAATNLVASDIPVLDWSKLTTGKPTTLEGYGITNAVKNLVDYGTLKVFKDIGAFSTAGADTGTLKISLPVTWNSTMFAISIKGYNYDSGGAYEIVLGGYNYSTTPLWANTSAVISGKAPFSKVRFAHDGTKCCILLGDPSTSWNVTHLFIDEVRSTFNTAIDYSTGWAFGFVTNEATLTHINQPVINNGLTVDSARRLETPRTISLSGDVTGSVVFDGTGNAAIATAYKASGVAAGTYRSVTVDSKGNVTAATNPTTIAGYGIIDAIRKTGDTATGKLIMEMSTGTETQFEIKKGVGHVRLFTRPDIDNVAKSEFGLLDVVTGATFMRYKGSSSKVFFENVALDAIDGLFKAGKDVETVEGAQAKATLAENNAKNASLPRTGGSIVGDVNIDGDIKIKSLFDIRVNTAMKSLDFVFTG